MTNIHKLLLGLAGASLLVASCTKQETPFVPGEQDQAKCQGVYFPAHEVGGAYEPDSVNNYKFTVIVARTDDESADGVVTVPVEISGSGAEYVTLPDVVFQPGQKEVEVEGEINKDVESSKEFDVMLAVKDNQYASLYSSKPSYLKFTFIIEKWNYLGEGTFYDLYLCDDGYPVDVYQNDADNNRYRVLKPYTQLYEDYGSVFVGYGYSLCTPVEKLDFTVYEAGQTILSDYGYETSVSEKGYVYYSAFNFGLHHPSYDADMYVMSPCDHYASYGDEANLALNKVSTWQENGLPSVVYMSGWRYMMGVGGWDYYTDETCAVIVLFPGGAFTDYSLEVEAGTSVDGELPISFTTGVDVDSVKYAIYLGELTDGEIQAKKTSIAAGTEEEGVDSFAPDTTGQIEYVFSFDSTALYTLVAVAFDAKGEAKGDADVVFGYVKAGDEEKVAITAGCSLNELPQSYISAGYSATSSLLVNVWGQNVTSASINIFAKEEFDADSLGLLWDELYELGESEIETLNTVGGLTTVWTSLKANTEYALLYTVSNGYAVQSYVYYCATPGLPRETVWYGKYTYNFWWTGDDIYKLAYDPNEELYIIENWGGGVDFAFSWVNDTTISVGPSYIGYDHSTYGPVYVVDAAQYWKGYEATAESKGYDIAPSFYDADSLTFYFNNEYIVSAGNFGRGWETFEYVSDQEPTSVAAPQSAASANSFNINSFKSNVQVPFSPLPYAVVEGERVIKAASCNVVSVEHKAREKKNHLIQGISKEVK